MIDEKVQSFKLRFFSEYRTKFLRTPLGRLGRTAQTGVEFLGEVRTITGSATLLEEDLFKWRQLGEVRQTLEELEKEIE